MVDSTGVRPRLEQVNLVVRDTDAAAAFYRRLGVEIVDGPPTWSSHHRNGTAAGGMHVELDSAAFAAVWNEGWPGGTGVVLGFRVDSRDDVDRRYDELTAAGYEGQQPPYDAFWGARFAVVADPDGHAVGLMSPIDPARRSAPPDPPG